METPDFLKEDDNALLKDFDEKFDNIESRMDRAVGYVDLYEEEFVSLKEGKDRFKAFGDPDDVVDGSSDSHVILLADHPICGAHLSVFMYPREGVPQVIGAEMLEEIMVFFNMVSHSSTFYIGYNSLCAGAEINQLHFEVIDLKLVKALADFSPKKTAYRRSEV